MAKTLPAINLIYLREGPYSVNKSEPDLDAIQSTSHIMNLFCFRGERKKKQVKHLEGFEPSNPQVQCCRHHSPSLRKLLTVPRGGGLIPVTIRLFISALKDLIAPSKKKCTESKTRQPTKLLLFTKNKEHSGFQMKLV